MKRYVIVGGAPISDYENIKNQFRDDDFFAVCDCGLRHIEKLGITPDLIIGDFDSFERPNTEIETIALPREKDDTDTFFAAKEGVKRGFDEFLLLGVIGGRLDHSLGNISILLYLDSLELKAKAVDDYSEMEIVSKKAAFVESKYPYFSLLNITGVAKGITIKNAKFPLENGEINCDYQYGVSNETINNSPAEVSVKEGKLLLIKVIKD
ncbi:MAG: thiamine diphosphokinase [Clostridia bacterium]|nr:thiamine diphosphokinase [Clostridia bacterium]